VWINAAFTQLPSAAADSAWDCQRRKSAVGSGGGGTGPLDGAERSGWSSSRGIRRRSTELGRLQPLVDARVVDVVGDAPGDGVPNCARAGK
jgi:hypothetical protein